MSRLRRIGLSIAFTLASAPLARAKDCSESLATLEKLGVFIVPTSTEVSGRRARKLDRMARDLDLTHGKSLSALAQASFDLADWEGYRGWELGWARARMFYDQLRQKFEAAGQISAPTFWDRSRDLWRSGKFQSTLSLGILATALSAQTTPFYFPSAAADIQSYPRTRRAWIQNRIQKLFFVLLAADLGVGTAWIRSAEIEASRQESPPAFRLQMQEQRIRNEKAITEKSKRTTAGQDLWANWQQDFKRRFGREPTPADSEYQTMIKMLKRGQTD